MNTIIALLRGINVSGQKKIRMDDLKMLCEQIGLQKVQTYIQSGNILFQSTIEDTEELACLITEAIQQKYGFAVETILCTPADLENIIAENPFQDLPEKGLYYTLLKQTPDAEKWAKLLESTSTYLPDRFAGAGKVIYLGVLAYGNSKLSNNFFENKLKVVATTRNHNTMLKLIELSRAF